MTEVIEIKWESLKSGTMLRMKDFPSIRLLKLDNANGCYFSYYKIPLVVKIKEYKSEVCGNYYYFQTNKDDWHPITTRLWIKDD